MSANVLPVSMDAERSILGGVLLDDTLYDEAAARLTADDFSLDAHRRIYSQMRGLRSRNCPVDMITLAEELSRSKEIEAIGGVAYLSSLIDGVPERPSIAHYVEIVKGKALLRGLINVCQGVIAEAIEQRDDPTDILGRTERAITELSETSVSDNLISLREASEPALNAMYRQQECGQLTFAIPEVDAITYGICPQDFVIIGGDPGAGKSAWMSQIAAENARKGHRVDIWSIEMRTDRVMRRMWCYESGLFYDKLKRDPHTMSAEDKQLFESAVGEVASWPVRVNDASRLGPMEFTAQARRAVLRDKTELVMLDHLHLMMESMTEKNDIEKLKVISAALRQFAKDYCPVVALSQLSRENKEQRGKRPKMDDLYGSRWLEANASLVLIPWLPVDGDGTQTHEDEIVVGKNREGQKKNVPVMFKGALMRFYSREVLR